LARNPTTIVPQSLQFLRQFFAARSRRRERFQCSPLRFAFMDHVIIPLQTDDVQQSAHELGDLVAPSKDDIINILSHDFL
jgi:hypothetical protein